MSRKDYIATAEIIRELRLEPQQRAEMVARFVTMFADGNPRFSPSRFRAACEPRSRYVVVENTPGYLPEGDDPFSGTWDECCEAMDDLVLRLIEDGYSVESNDGCGFRSPGGVRRTYLLPPEANEHTLSRVVEVMADLTE
jgi:hypothetical protein